MTRSRAFALWLALLVLYFLLLPTAADTPDPRVQLSAVDHPTTGMAPPGRYDAPPHRP